MGVDHLAWRSTLVALYAYRTAELGVDRARFLDVARCANDEPAHAPLRKARPSPQLQQQIVIYKFRSWTRAGP